MLGNLSPDYCPDIQGVLATCTECGCSFVIPMTREQHRRLLENDGNIQDIIPEVSADLRELLIGGTCGECFDKLFSEDDERNNE
jgi:hypothetical protein